VSLFNKLRFKFIDFLVGNASYMRNMSLNWYEPKIIVQNICYWSDTHNEGDPLIVIINESGSQKLSESMLVDSNNRRN